MDIALERGSVLAVLPAVPALLVPSRRGLAWRQMHRSNLPVISCNLCFRVSPLPSVFREPEE